MKWFLVNPLNYFRGLIKFPMGYFEYNPCDCGTCRNKYYGWGIMFLFFGFNKDNKQKPSTNKSRLKEYYK